ncbi:MAG TPA: hypothetical protein VFP84_05195 [Kofleriaceae bacterium]|nr:hypothetical protein [Kofleriaceae bacterium]
MLTANHLVANHLVANHLVANHLVANRLVSTRLTDHRLTANMRSAGSMLQTEDGREVFAFLVSCALPADITVVAEVDDQTFEFGGDVGLAPEWIVGPLGREGQGWVSACLFSRVSAREISVPISERGPTYQLRTDSDERENWSVEEGAFFGNFFGNPDQPIQWFACRGAGQAAGEAGGLVGRDCTEPDPANPGLTKCGFNFAGDCGSFSEDQACESFSEHGLFYRRCHTQPLDTDHHHHHGRAGDLFDGLNNHGHGHDRDRVFEQVITTYVTP